MDPALLEFLNWGVALVPVLLMLALFTWLDAFKLMSFGEIFVLLVLGGLAALACYPVSGRLLDQLPIGFSTYSRFIAPWIEETVKLLPVVGLFWFNRIGYKLDAVISGFAIGAGFSLVENIVYLSIYPEYGLGTWLVRGLGTAVMHGATLAVIAAIAHELAERETRDAASDFNFNLLWFLPGLLVAIALHTLFNQFPDRPALAMLGAVVAAPMIVLAVLQFGTAEARGWLANEQAAHAEQLHALKSGGWPDGAAGARVATLAHRLGSKTARKMHRYWELQAWLVVEAEKAMLAQSENHKDFDPDKVHAAFAELEHLRNSMGRSTFAALKALLPFSRNDYWEVSELRQRLR